MNRYLKKIPLGNVIRHRKIKTPSPNDPDTPFVTVKSEKIYATRIRNDWHFILKGCGIENISDIKGLDDLKDIDIISLNLANNHLISIESLEKYKCLRNIKDLNVSYNTIYEMNGLSKFSKLTTLDLSHNRIREIRGLVYCEKLGVLILNHNLITSIQGLEFNAELEYLDLGHNKLTSTRGLEANPKITRLYLNHNDLKGISGLNHLKSLEEIYLEFNKLESIEGISWKKLRKLDASSNYLTALYLYDVEEGKQPYMTFKDNKIREIHCIYDYLLMSYLDLTGNEISELGWLENICGEYVYLSGNRISSLDPKAWYVFKELHLEDNPIDPVNIPEFLGAAKVYY